MAPTGFQIWVDQSMRQPAQQQQQQQQAAGDPAPQSENVKPPPPVRQQTMESPVRCKREALPPNRRFYFDERRLYPVTGGEYSFEEINFASWKKAQMAIMEKRRVEAIQKENADLRSKLETLSQQLTTLINTQLQTQQQAQQQAQQQQQQLQQQQEQQQQQILQQQQALLQQQQQHTGTLTKQPNGPPSPTIPSHHRLSVVPQSLQPAQGNEYNDMSLYGAINDAPSVVQDLWRNTFAHDKFTLPIDQSQYIKDNVPTSTPASKRTGGSNDNDNKRCFNNRRISRPSMGGSPTLKLSPITETSRDCNSKSSSSSSAMSGTPSTTKKAVPAVLEPIIPDEPDRDLDPNDPSTYRMLLRGLPEPLERRSGYYRLNRSLPKIRQGACFQAGQDSYLVDKEVSSEASVWTAQLLTDDSNDCSSDMPIKIVCFRVDQPTNEWLYYICNELHRRLVKQRAKPDVELSIMITNPAIMYSDGSILVDEHFRFVTLQHFFEACTELNKPFPKSVAAYITLELIQLIRQIHSCDIIHMNVCPKNVLITCCPTRDDIANVDVRTSIVKLIGFDRAMDTRLLPQGFKFECELSDYVTCEMMDSKPWTHEIDWFGALNCIHKMFFLTDMTVSKNDVKWSANKQFKGFPTSVWSSLFDELLNISDFEKATAVVDKAADELSTWIKANISFVLKEADTLDRTLEEYCKATNKSIRT